MRCPLACLAACFALAAACAPGPAALIDEAAAADARETVRVEVDVLPGVDSGELEAALRIAAATFAQTLVAPRFEIQREELDVGGPLVDWERKTEVIEATRDDLGAVHLIIASRGAGAHGAVHYGKGAGATPRQAGLFVFSDTVAADFAANPLLAGAGLGEAQLLARTIAHELGHALGCAHQERGAAVMVQNSRLGAVTAESLPHWVAALSGSAGFPEFALAECLDPGARLSVELASIAAAE